MARSPGARAAPGPRRHRSVAHRQSAPAAEARPRRDGPAPTARAEHDRAGDRGVRDHVAGDARRPARARRGHRRGAVRVDRRRARGHDGDDRDEVDPDQALPPQRASPVVQLRLARRDDERRPGAAGRRTAAAPGDGHTDHVHVPAGDGLEDRPRRVVRDDRGYRARHDHARRRDRRQPRRLPDDAPVPRPAAPDRPDTPRSRCHPWADAVVLPDTHLGAGARVFGHSVVLRGEELPAGTRWQGTPVVAM